MTHKRENAGKKPGVENRRQRKHTKETKEAREARILDWWRNTEYPTVYGAIVANNTSYQTVCRILRSNNIQWHRDRTGTQVRKHRAIMASVQQKLRELQKVAFIGIPKTCCITPPRLPCKVLMADDQHGIFWNPDVTEKMLSRDGDADLVVSFEMLSLDAFSRFRRTYRSDTLAELEVIDHYFEMVGAERVILGVSNHNERFTKWVANLGSDPERIEVASQAWAALIDRYIKHRPRFIPSTNIQIGDALFSHMDVCLATPLASVERIGMFATANGPNLGLKPPFGIVCQGHTHSLAMAPWKGHRAWLMESGCSCHLPRYVVENTRATPVTLRPMINGYARVILDRNGKVDMTQTSPVFLGYAYKPNTT
ncbi:MAG: hypothetical protein ABIK37_03655 [candidate division WOR-3 bacterium]